MNFRKMRRSRKNSMSVVMNSERWRQFGRKASRKEDIILSEEESDTEYHQIKDFIQECFDQQSEDSTEQDIDAELSTKQTLILSTLVPDEILLMDNFDPANPRRFVGVLLMADVSGYTALSERYNNFGKGGTFRLTVTLNTYLGSLTELIYSHGGDIIKFAGDAFLALWKTDKKSFLSHTIHTVIACALIIQHSFSSYETDVKVQLKVKLAISAGNLIFSSIGSGIDMNYVLFGLPVIEAKQAESVCASGEVKLTPSAWGHCYSRNYDHTVHPDGHVTIRSILYDPREKDVSKPFSGFGAAIRKIKKNFASIENLPDDFFDSSKNISAAEAHRNSEILSVRKTILLAEEKQIGSKIRKFMIRPVLTQIDAHQPLEYLTEMRQVSILFITLKPKGCPFSQLITIVNNAYKITCEIVYKSLGCVNKIILFDKDIMILVIFGLRGFKHESEAQAALKCAYGIKKAVAALDGVKDVSLGVTTGQVYCGVVGHPLRREFTVIGATVNRAARLMCAFKNKVTCDENTFILSKMSKNGFTLQPKIYLKGIGYAGNLYEYTEDLREKQIHDIPMVPPLLNCEDEMEYFKAWLEDSECHRDFDALLLVGESRIGKTRLLECMARHAKNSKHKICFIHLTSVHSATSYLALSQIFNQILGVEDPSDGFIKEEKIVRLLKDYDEDLCYLNNVIKVRFAYHEGIYSLNDDSRSEKAKQMFSKLIMAIEDIHVIFLDDIQNLDANSWEYISLMFKSIKLFTICTATSGKTSSANHWLFGVYNSNSVRKVVLGNLTPNWIPSLACQILDVQAVPNDLCSALQIKCNGIPGTVESFLVNLFSSGALEIKKVPIEEIDMFIEEQLQFPDLALLHPQAINSEDQELLDEFLKEDDTGELSICLVTDKEQLKTNINVQNMDALIMMQIDSLTPYQQLLLKISSAIGNVICRELLENIMYENNRICTAKAIKRLFSIRLFSCANNFTRWMPRNSIFASTLSFVSTAPVTAPGLTCDCPFDFDPENPENENLPKYAFCQIMKFRNKNSQKTCYDLLPLNQKKEFHSRIVLYLESNIPKCPACGGPPGIVQPTSRESSFSSVRITSSIESMESIDLESRISDNDKESKDIDRKGPNISFDHHKIRYATSESISAKVKISTNGRKASSYTSIPQRSEDSQIENDKGEEERITSILKSREYNKSASMKKVTMSRLFSKRYSFEEEAKNYVFDMFRKVMEACNLNDWHDLHIKGSNEDLFANGKGNKKQGVFCIKIEKGVSQTDLKKCTCTALSVQICKQLIHHAQQAEMKSKVVEYMVKYCNSSLLDNNLQDCFPMLDVAETNCREDKKSENPALNKFERRRFLGRIYALRATFHLLNGNFSAAKLEMIMAAKIYRVNLSKRTNLLPLVSTLTKIKSRNYRLHKASMEADSVFCLNTATLLYSALGDETTARISAVQALDIVMNVKCSVTDICDAFSNAIQVEIDRDSPETTTEIERLAVQVLSQLLQPIKFQELWALGKLFLVTFRARTMRGELDNAIRAGVRSLTVSRFLLAESISLEIIPDLVYTLISRRRIEVAIDVLQLTLHMGQSQMSYDFETWYYALCMDLILDAGFQLESPYEISRYAEYALLSGRSAGQSRRRLVLGLWTYWMRADYEKKAKRFENEALSWMQHTEDYGSLTTLLSCLRLAEGMLECLARKIDDLKKVVDLMELRSIADKLLARLEKDARLMRTIYPRWLLLKAYGSSLSCRKSASNCFTQALEEATRIGNRLEESMARAASSDSQVWRQRARTGDFPKWQDVMEQVHGLWHQLIYKMATDRQ